MKQDTTADALTLLKQHTDAGPRSAFDMPSEIELVLGDDAGEPVHAHAPPKRR